MYVSFNNFFTSRRIKEKNGKLLDIFSDEEKNCLSKIYEEILDVSNHLINIANAIEPQVEGALFAVFNKKVGDVINKYLLTANFDTNPQYNRKKPVRTLKISSIAINIRNETIIGANWVLYLQYHLDDKLFEEKMIPIQTKLENKEGMFKALKSGEFGNDLPQSSRLKDLTEESHYLFLCHDRRNFLLPVETVSTLKDEYNKDTFPHSRDYLFKEEKRIGLNEFLLAANESRVGETESETISKIKSYIKEFHIPTLELILKISSEVYPTEERVHLNEEK